MKLFAKILAVLLILSIHYVAFPVPIVEGFLSYIILCNPRWFRAFLGRLDS